MSDTPYARGGIIPSPGPGSDNIPLTQIRLKSGETFMNREAVHAWLASGLPLEKWMRQNKLGPYKEAICDDTA